MNKISRGKKYYFKIENVETYEIIIPEFPSVDLGSRIWLCAPILCKYLVSVRNELKDKRVIELGCGTALPGMLASKLGAKVILSDMSSKHFEERIKKCLSINHIDNIDTCNINWGCIDETLINLPSIDFIIASDCFYHSLDYEKLISTISYLLNKNPHAQFLFSYQSRSAGSSIEILLIKWGLKCQSLHLSDTNVRVTTQSLCLNEVDNDGVNKLGSDADGDSDTLKNNKMSNLDTQKDSSLVANDSNADNLEDNYDDGKSYDDNFGDDDDKEDDDNFEEEDDEEDDDYFGMQGIELYKITRKRKK